MNGCLLLLQEPLRKRNEFREVDCVCRSGVGCELQISGSIESGGVALDVDTIGYALAGLGFACGDVKEHLVWFLAGKRLSLEIALGIALAGFATAWIT
jgi:hypothetical protein